MRAGPERCRSTSTTTTTRPRLPNCSTRSGRRRSSTTAGSAPLLAGAARTDRLLVDVDDGTETAPLPGSIPFEAAIAAARPTDTLPVPSPDDLYLVCTGGTTGRPKGVLWRQGDVYVAAMGGAEGATAETIAADCRAARSGLVRGAAADARAAQWTVFAALHNGGTVLLHDDAAPFDARTILETAEREHVTTTHDRRRRVRAADPRRAARAPVRPLVVATACDRRRNDRAGAQAGAARTAPRRDDHRRLRRVGDRRHGVRRIDEGRADAALPSASTGAAVLSADRTAFPRSRRRRDRLDRARRSGSARLPERSGEDRADVPDRRRTPALGAGRPRHASRRRHDRSARPRFDGGQQRWREDLRGGGRGRDPPSPRRPRRARRRPAERPLR